MNFFLIENQSGIKIEIHLDKIRSFNKINMGIKLPGLYAIIQLNTTKKKEKSKCLNYTLLSADKVNFFLISPVTSGTTIPVLVNNSLHINFLYSITNHNCFVNFSNSFSLTNSYTTKTLNSRYLQEKFAILKIGFGNCITGAGTFVNAFFLNNCKNIFVHIPEKTTL